MVCSQTRYMFGHYFGLTETVSMMTDNGCAGGGQYPATLNGRQDDGVPIYFDMGIAKI